MMRFGAKLPDGRKLFGIGLSRANCERLLQGHPIAFPLEQIGGKGELLIVAGETEQAIVDELQREGLEIGPHTDLHISDKLKS